MTNAVIDHPAPFSEAVLAEITRIVNAEADAQSRALRILDPFAGIGLIHRLRGWGHETDGIELEPEWAQQTRPYTRVGDATALKAADCSYDVVATSPAFGNRMADAYGGDAKGSTRFTYRIALGRELTHGSGAGMQWGADYRAMHTAAVNEMIRVVRPGGLIIVNMKNHVRDKRVMPVVEWWLTTLLARRCLLVEAVPVTTGGLPVGQNWEARVEADAVLVVRTPADGQGMLPL